MKKVLSFILFSLAAQLAWAQSGTGYDPVNPPDPDVYYTLMLEASPRSGGTVSSNDRQKLSAGQSTIVNASPRLGYEFKHWMMGDSLVSTNSSFSFTMPEKDVVLTAYFEWIGNSGYDPVNPDDPDAEGYSHHVYVYATPSAGGYFNSSSFTLIEGKTTNIYAYPREGYRFESWMCNGEVVSTDNPLSIKMGTADIAYTATFVYNPVSPGEPSPNVFNSATGEVIIDNFTPGSLNSAIYTVVGSSENYPLVQSILVIGRMTSSDFGFARSYRNCSLIDLSRTTGYMEVPSWSFEGAEALTKLILPASVERIGNNAFNGCRNLSELYCYATTPPEVSENVFTEVESALVVRVPAPAVSLYQKANGWKYFTILPLDEETCSMIINLPSDASDGRYKNMYIEVENAISGQTYKYLITDRTSYTFANMIRNTSYNIRVKNAVDAILGEKEKVMLGEEDLTINFESLRQPQTLTAKVLAPDGTDLTSQTSITWFNEDGSLLSNGAKVSGVLEGTNVTYRIVLPQALAMQYKMPTDVAYTVKPSENNITCQLQAFEEVALSGRILDVTTEKPIANATITISQLLNGKYTKSATTRTDNEGKFTISVFNEQSSMIVSATNYLSQTSEYADFSDGQQLGDVLLKAITGAVITVGFTYTESVEDGQTTEEQNWYSDEANVTFSLYNQTQNKAIVEFNIQNGSIVLLEEVAEGDVLIITAKSKTEMFRDVAVTTEIDARNRASVIFPIVELGGLKAYYTESENNGVVGILYDANGVLLCKSSFNGDTLTVSNLADGNYTLVTMGSSNFFNSVLNLSELTNAGLTEGRDFVKNTLIVSSGHITKLNVGSVPTFDESQFYYTGESTSFSANKSQVTIGNYITLRAKVDFKDEYATAVRDLKLIVDLPESCPFVDNSVLTGNGMGSYEVAGNRVTVNLNEQNELVRFCVIPTTGGTCKPSAFVQFNYDGETIMQPIGSAYFNAQNLAISVPIQTADSVVVVNGTAQTDCIVKIYDGDVLVGQTRSLANGRWSARVNLYKPYSHSFHNIYAEVGTASGQTLLTDTKLVEFDKTMTQLKTITMLYNGNTIVFDQIEGTTSTNTYSYVPGNSDFTFIAQFTQNDTTLIKNLVFKVLASDGTVRRISSTFSSKHNAWVGKATYDNSSRIPANVSAEYTSSAPEIENTNEQFEDEVKMLEWWISYIEQQNEQKASLELIEDNDSSAIYLYSLEDLDSEFEYEIIELDYIKSLDLINNMQFDYIQTGNGFMFKHVSIDEGYLKTTIIDTEYEIAFEIKLVNLGNNTITNRKKANSRISKITKSVVRFIKNRFKSGNFLGDLGEVYSGVLDVMGIGKYLEVPNFEIWCDILENYLDSFEKQSKSITEALTQRCDDGSLKLTEQQIDLYNKKRNEYNEQCDQFAEVYYSYLELYLTKLRNAIYYDILTGAFTKVLGGIVRAGKIMKNSKNSNYFKYILPAKNTNQRNWLTNALGIGFTWLIDRTTEIIDPISNPEFADFTSVSKDLNTWAPKSYQNKIELFSDLRNKIQSSYKECKKEEDPEDDEPDYPTPPLKPSVDPSGYVYEGISSNRIQGVTATAYYMETTEDMYGVLHDEPKVWDAEEYAQENPLFTDENGMYQWDVPQGLWQVKFEKEGYETTYSEWLPVPPPQLDVNIAMTQARQPEVKEAHAYEDGVEITFDKYMQPAYLTADNILVSQGGEYVKGEVKLMDEETAYEDESVKYASRIRFVPETPFAAGEVTLVVANCVRSYADIQMQDTYTQTFDIEKEVKEIVVDEQVKVPYEGTKMITVKVLPADAAAGRTLHAESASEMLATLTNADAIISETGEAQFEVTGELPGSTAITFSIDGVQVTATTVVNIEIIEGKVVRVPQASLASGTAVYRGTTVVLSAEEGQKIWYTLDGSCPCDENGTRQLYTGPLTISGDVTVKMMAEDSEGDVSEVVTLTYMILQSKDGVALNNGWTWVSFNMKNDEALSSTNTALASGTWTVSDVIKDNQYVDMYSAAQHKWIGTMSKHGKLTNAGMYKIHSSQAQKLGLTGEAVHPAETNISISTGWNYISYVPLVSMSVANALSGYEAQDGDVIKSQDAFATYSTTNGWEGDLTTLDAGKGYMLKHNTSGQTSFCYPIPSVNSTPSNAKKEAKAHRYADNMNIVGEIYGITVEDGDSLIAYVGGEVRGASRLINGKKVFLTIHGDHDANVALVLQRDGEIIATASDMIGYKSNEVVGTGDAPTAITFSSESVNTGNAIGNIKAIYSMNGMKMGTKRLNAVPAGAYIIYSEIGGNTHITKLIKQ